MIRRGIKIAINAGGMVAGICIAVIVVIMAIEVFCRYILNSPTYWALEVSIYLLVAMMAFGSPYTLRIGGHVAVDILYNLMPAVVRNAANRVNMLIVLFFAAVLVWYGAAEVHHAWRLRVSSLTPLSMPLIYPLSLIPIGGLMLAIQALELFFYPTFESDTAEDDGLPMITE